MATVKTAISLDAHLFDRVENVAQESGLSRSRLITLALEAYLKRWENQRLLESLNEAYAEGPTEEDKAFLRFARRQMARQAREDEW